MSRKVKIRGAGKEPEQPYPLNEFPEDVIRGLCSRIVHLVAIGRDEMDGDTFSQIYAQSIGGEALPQPLGVSDVIWKNCAWSAKTVKEKSPHEKQKVRLISGRNSPHYSAGIRNPNEDVDATGQAVLDIYNKRILEARGKSDDVRLLVLIRNMAALEFTLFERDLSPIRVNDYKWRVNKRDNFEGCLGDKHCFTWQPHGSQFTVIEDVPASACRFKINRRPVAVKMENVLQLVNFQPDWIEITAN